MDLAEQAEREIAEQLGFKIDLSRKTLDTGVSGYTFSYLERHAMTVKIVEKLYSALVRDRCSLLKLRKAGNEVIAASFAGSSEPWDKAVAALRSALEGK